MSAVFLVCCCVVVVVVVVVVLWLLLWLSEDVGLGMPRESALIVRITIIICFYYLFKLLCFFYLIGEKFEKLKSSKQTRSQSRGSSESVARSPETQMIDLC